MKLYHTLMAERTRPKTVASSITVAEVFDKFLGWCRDNREPRTFEGHRAHIQRFCSALPETEIMPATALRPYHITEYVSRQKGWGDSTRRQAIQELQRPFNWAEKQGYIDKSPIRHIEKPSAKRREQSVSSQEWAAIRDSYEESDPFRHILEFLWETGCRPQEAKRLQTRHVDLARHRVVFPKGESKGKRRERIIVLTPRAEEIIAKRMKRSPDSFVFLNRTGKPWTGYSMSCRFKRLKERLGTKYAAYSLRHGFADRMLMAGVDCLTVAAMMGHHSGTDMLTQHYSALDRQTEYLRKQLSSG